MSGRVAVRWSAALLVAYALALAAVAFWPTPVDRDAGPWLDAVLRALPGLSYGAIEWTANVVLFVPFGVLGALLVRGRVAALLGVTAAGALASALIESAQTLALPARTGSIADVVANTLGALVGAAIVALLRRRSGTAHAEVAPPGRAPRRRVEAVASVDDDAPGGERRGVLG